MQKNYKFLTKRKMAVKVLIVVCFQVITSYVCLTSGNMFLSKPWDHDIYSGRQWDDLITQTQVESPLVIRPAVLVMYKPSCERILFMEKLIEDRLPPQNYMVYAKYDYETTPKHIWYNMDARDDLKARYTPKACPDYMFFPKGKTHHEAPLRYSKDSGDMVFHWIWKQFTVQINVSNMRSSRIMVEFQGRGPKISAFTIDGGQDMIIEGYVSYFVLISDMETQTFLYGAELTAESDGTLIVLEVGKYMEEKAVDWYNSMKAKQEEKSFYWRSWRWNVAEIYLHDFKQPVLLEKFTDLGYKKGKMPEEMYRDLINFYRENIKDRKPEKHEVEPAINDSEVKCSMVYLSDEMIQKIAITMKPLMEEWSNCSLELSRLYGIREYYHGNLLRNHVDRVTTHVISVILQIDQDLQGGREWELEIIGFDGNRKNVTLLPGEMLFYESATLIHGRPFPYQGQVFANAFLHYKPVHGWGWTLTDDNAWIVNNGQKVEKIDILETANTFNKKANLENFVEKIAHKHDEL